MKLLSNTNDQNYNVSRLRSLYATLLNVIAPGNETAYPLLNNINHKNNDQAEEYSVRNFRRSDSFDGMSDEATNDGCETVIFDNDKNNFKCLAIHGHHVWRTLSATVSIEKEGLKGGVVAIRNDEAVVALVKARKVEYRVIELIRKIGEVVVYGEQRSYQHRSSSGRRPPRYEGHDPIFEYFCDKNMLSLFVDIIKSKPFFDLDQWTNTTSLSVSPPSTPLTGVVWTALVKSQVLQTISILISNIQEPKSFYYLLSNNYINEVISSIAPLHQWTAKALDEILPIYISLLKSLTLRLAAESHLFPFFCSNRNGTSSSLPVFPLFYATVEVASSPLVQSHDFAHTTALNIILNICQLSDPSIKSVIGELEQQILQSYLCKELSEKYETISKLFTGSRVDAKRHTVLKQELSSLENQLHFINDLLWCGVRTLNVRFCEYIMRWFVYEVLLKNLNQHILPFLKMNWSDTCNYTVNTTYIGKEESRVQTSVFFLAQIYMVIDFAPLVKMTTVALLHPYSPTQRTIEMMIYDGKDYIFTPILNDVAQDNFMVADSQNIVEAGQSQINEPNVNSCENTERIVVELNPSRKSILSLLETKDERFTLTVMLMESILKSKVIKFDTLQMMHILPDFKATSSLSNEKKQSPGEYQRETENYEISPFETSSPFEYIIGNFFKECPNKSSSRVGSIAVDCAISFSLCFIDHLIQSYTEKGTNFEKFSVRFLTSPLIKGITSLRQRLALDCERLKKIAGVGDLFGNLVEMEIKDRYTEKNADRKILFIRDLLEVNAMTYKHNPDWILLKSQDVNTNEVEDARFAIRLVLHLNQICDAFCQLHSKLNSMTGLVSLGSPTRWDTDSFMLQTSWSATDTLLRMSGLGESLLVGSDIDVRGRTFFYFYPFLDTSHDNRSPINSALYAGAGTSDKDLRRQMADKMLIHASKRRKMIVVIDRTQVIILKPSLKDVNRGKILCFTPVRNIVASCCDNVWLHIAVRDHQDIGVLVSKGNMALRFDNVATAQIVKDCVEKSRTDYKNELSHEVDELLATAKRNPFEYTCNT